MNLDRFAQGLPDPQKYTPKVIDKCACGCGAEIVEGYEHIKCDGFWFHSTECFLKFNQAEFKIAGEVFSYYDHYEV